jgi:cation:H+ antiporter
MLTSLSFVALGLALLVLGGEALLRGAVSLATLLKLTPAVIGLTVVAAGTSVPELAVSGIAAAQGNVDICVANVIGSNIFNMTAIIGMCALIAPVPILGNTIKLEYPVLVLVTLLCLVITQDATVTWLDAVLCLTIYVAFTAYLVSLVRAQMTVDEAKDLKAEVDELVVAESKPQPQARLPISLLLVAAGVALLAGGAHFTVEGAVGLAKLWGLSERVIGLTIVSAGTGLPEVVASLASSMRGRSDMAVGNVIGSNLFNILGILGISGLIAPLPVQAALISSDEWWMMGITLLLFPIMFTGRRFTRWEGLLLIGVYAAYLGILLKQAA